MKTGLSDVIRSCVIIQLLIERIPKEFGISVPDVVVAGASTTLPHMAGLCCRSMECSLSGPLSRLCSGHFTIRTIPRGDYKLFAWEALESFGYYDLDLVKKSESLGKPVHVIESSKQTMDIKVIPSAP
jgi:hypothetical protein